MDAAETLKRMVACVHKQTRPRESDKEEGPKKKKPRVLPRANPMLEDPRSLGWGTAPNLKRADVARWIHSRRDGVPHISILCE